jgi:hypothetical protein
LQLGEYNTTLRRDKPFSKKKKIKEKESEGRGGEGISQVFFFKHM